MDYTRSGVILSTHHYKACVAFYRDVLGLPLLFSLDEPGSTLTCFDLGGAYLMVEPGGPKAQSKKSLAQNPTKLRFNVADVEAAAVELNAKGVAVTRYDYDWGSTAEFVDPDGNACALRDEASFGQSLAEL